MWENLKGSSDEKHLCGLDWAEVDLGSCEVRDADNLDELKIPEVCQDISVFAPTFSLSWA